MNNAIAFRLPASRSSVGSGKFILVSFLAGFTEQLSHTAPSRSPRRIFEYVLNVHDTAGNQLAPKLGICVLVYVPVCMSVCWRVCVLALMHMRQCACAHACMCGCTCVHACTCVHVFVCWHACARAWAGTD